MSLQTGRASGAASAFRVLRRPRRLPLLALAGCLLLPALSACGSSDSSKTTAQTVTVSNTLATTQTEHGPNGLHGATIPISTTAVLKSGAISPQYTCHGANISPPLKWKSIPALYPATKELMVFVRTVESGKVKTSWALAGIKPTVTELVAGQTPAGAIVGRSSSGKVGYDLCPANSAFITMAVYALPQANHLSTGFDPEALRHKLESDEVQWGGVTMVAYVPPGTQ